MQYGQQRTAVTPHDGFAVGSLIAGIAACAPVGLILGWIALRRIKRDATRGRGLAITGIILSIVWVGAIAAVIAIGPTLGPEVALFGDPPVRDDSGTVTEAGTVSVLELRDGDCIRDVGSGDGTEFFFLEVVPCSTPHKGQAIARFGVTGSGYPGLDPVIEQADHRCPGLVSNGVADGTDLTRYEMFYFHPTETSWELGDRAVVCSLASDTAWSTSLVDE